MSPERKYAKVIVQAVGLGLGTGFFAVGYLWLIHVLQHWLWSDQDSSAWFSGDVWTIVIPLVTGLLVGLVYKFLPIPSRFPGFIKELEHGEVEPRTAPAAIGIAVLSLVGGASLGPEAPLGTAGGAAGTWLARRERGDKDKVRQLSFVGISGSFGGLMSTPIGGPLLAFELEHDHTQDYYYSNLVPGVVAGAFSFGIVWSFVGTPFENLLSVPDVEFRPWMLLAAIGLGALAFLAAVVVGRIMVWMTALLRPLDGYPVLRGLAGGAIIAAIGFTLPLTLFSGQESLPAILDDFAAFGIPLLIALALLKAAALGASLGSGMYGGPIFPMFFMGGVLGIAVHAVFPGIPLGLAVGCMMAGLGAAAALIPLSMGILVTIMLGASFEIFGAVVFAAVVAYALRVTVLYRQQESDAAESLDDGTQVDVAVPAD
ncbi:MAG: chloride channel protein [Acidimicrobiia bacterium]|nr:chloride channel protein [Acidimicrobiia bacterium]